MLSTREKGGGDAFFQKRVPKGAPDYLETCRIEFPSGRHADEICPTEIAVVAWCAHMGTITFHPWPVRREDADHPDELRLDLDPQPGTDFEDAVRVAGVARELLGELGYAAFPKTSGGRGIHIYVRIEPRWTFTDMRHAAIAFGRELERRLPGEVTTKWWKEERGERIFVDYNQNARDRTIASAYSVRPKPGAPVSAPVTWDELTECQPEDFNVETMPGRFAEVGDRHAAIDDVPTRSSRCSRCTSATRPRVRATCPTRPTIPKMPGEPKRVQPSRDTRPQARLTLKGSDRLERRGARRSRSMRGEGRVQTAAAAACRMAPRSSGSRSACRPRRLPSSSSGRHWWSACPIGPAKRPRRSTNSSASCEPTSSAGPGPRQGR